MEQPARPGTQQRRPYVSVRLYGAQAGCAAVMRALGSQLGPAGILPGGASFQGRGGPDQVIVRMRVDPSARPPRRKLLRVPRRRRRKAAMPDIPATMIPLPQATRVQPARPGRAARRAAARRAA